MVRRSLVLGLCATGAATVTLLGLALARPIANRVGETHRPVAAPVAPLPPVRPTIIGMNTGTPSSWQNEWPFIDLVQSVARIMVIDPSGKWMDAADAGALLKRNIDGFPIDAPKGRQYVVTLGGGVHLPPGPLKCSVSPHWDPQIVGDGRVTERFGGDFKIEIKPGDGPPNLGLMLTANADHANLTKVSCLMPGGSKTSGPFNPAFLAEMQPFRVIRFMDWMKTNSAEPRLWSERTTPQSFSQADNKGVSVEYMVDLANRLKSDPWFTLPMDVDAGYYRQFATYVRDHLSPDRKVYIELSNEVWNNDFKQAKDAASRGLAAHDGADAGAAQSVYYAKRVIELMKTWTDVFGGNARLVRVVGAQNANTYKAEQILAVPGLDQAVDAVAVAPYFGENIATYPAGADRLTAAFAGGPRLVDDAINGAVAIRQVAARHKLRLIGYEGGQAYMSFLPNDAAQFNALQHDPRMGALYHRFIAAWRARVGDVLVLFDGISSPGGGSFGHKEWTGQRIAETPKMAAVVQEIGQ